MSIQLTLQEISNLFHIADQDKNGSLSRDEIAAIITQVKSTPPTQEELNMCMSQMDKNGDGVVNEAEFIEVMSNWLGMVPPSPGQKKRGLENSPEMGGNRKHALSEMANFFRQFSPIVDFNTQQSKILSRQHQSFNRGEIRRDFVILTNEKKAEEHKKIVDIMTAGRQPIIDNLYSMDWMVVLHGVDKVHTLLSVVEIFSSSQEKIEFISFILQVFEGVTQVDPPSPLQTSNTNHTSIIRRICALLAPDVPENMQLKLYTACLDTLFLYIIGPNLPSGAGRNFDAWNPERRLTKQVVEVELLPKRLDAIFSKHKVVTENNQSLLRSLMKVIGIFSESHTGCLECILVLGFRRKIVDLLRQSGIKLPLLRAGLDTLSVLCGYTHSFDGDLPTSLKLDDKQELFDILYTQHYILNALIAANSIDVMDRVAISSICMILKCMLPLCNPSDNLFTSVVGQLIELLNRSWSNTNADHAGILVALDQVIEDLTFGSKQLALMLWSLPGFRKGLLKQLAFVPSSANTDNESLSVISSCLEVVYALLQHGSEAVHLLNTVENLEFLKFFANKISASDLGWMALAFIEECLNLAELKPFVISYGVIDSIFSLYNKFKVHTNTASRVLGVHGGPVYNVKLMKEITRLLTSFLSKDVTNHIIYFTPENIECFQQFHTIMCLGLEGGLLVPSDDLHEMSDMIVTLMESIINAFVLVKTTYHSADYATEQLQKILKSWNSKLAEAFDRSQEESRKASGMEIDDGESSSTVISTLNILAIPRWSNGNNLTRTIHLNSNITLQELFNGFFTLYGCNVKIYFLSNNVNNVQLTTSSQWDQLLQLHLSSLKGSTDQTPLTLFLEVDSSSTFNTIQINQNKDAMYSAIGLKPKAIALRELEESGRSESLKIDSNLMAKFYDYFSNSNTVEINQEQFVSALTSPTFGFSETASKALFNGFDVDQSKSLSLKEIAIGFAKLNNGTAEDKLLLIFEAYDQNKDNFLDMSEVTNMIGVSTGCGIDECVRHAQEVFNKVDINKDSRLTYKEFREAALSQLLPLGILFSDSGHDSNGKHHHQNYVDNNDRNQLRRRHSWVDTSNNNNNNYHQQNNNFRGKGRQRSMSGYNNSYQHSNFRPESPDAGNYDAHSKPQLQRSPRNSFDGNHSNRSASPQPPGSPNHGGFSPARRKGGKGNPFQRK